MNIRRILIWCDQIEFVFHRRELRVSLIDANNCYCKCEVMVGYLPLRGGETSCWARARNIQITFFLIHRLFSLLAKIEFRLARARSPLFVDSMGCPEYTQVIF